MFNMGRTARQGLLNIAYSQMDLTYESDSRTYIGNFARVLPINGTNGTRLRSTDIVSKWMIV